MSFAESKGFREPVGKPFAHRGAGEVRSSFTTCFDAGGIGLQRCNVTEDGARRAWEYNCVRWGSY